MLRRSRRSTASRRRWAGASTSCAPCSPTTTAATAPNVWAGVADRRRAVPPAARAARLRRREGADLRRHPRQDPGRRARGLARGRRQVRRRRAALGRRHHRPRVARPRSASGSRRRRRPSGTSRTARLAVAGDPATGSGPRPGRRRRPPCRGRRRGRPGRRTSCPRGAPRGRAATRARRARRRPAGR